MSLDAPVTTPPAASPDPELDELAAVIGSVDDVTGLDSIVDQADAKTIAAAVLRHQATHSGDLDPIPHWYIVLSTLRFDTATPAEVRDAVEAVVEYVLALRTQRARILRLFDEMSTAAATEVAQHRDALATLLLSADDTPTPTVDAAQVAAMREGLKAARAVVNVADDEDVIGSGHNAMIRLAHALAAVNA